MIDYANLMTQATILRKELGEDCNSPIDISALVQRIEGLTIVYYPMGENLSGMCIKGAEGTNVIAINSSMTLGRQRYSIAHELYHLKFDDTMISVCAKKIGTGKDVERSADMFASYFLMPNAALVELADRLASKHGGHHLSLYDVIHIEQYYGVSHQAMVYRLLKTPFLDKDEADSILNIPIRRAAEMLGYSSDLYKPSPESKRYVTYGNYINQAEELLSKGLVSEGKYEELMLAAFRADLVYDDENEGGDVID